MTSRNRPSGTRPRLNGTDAADGTLPPYQKPSHPLSGRAQAQLGAIHNTHSLRKLKEHHNNVGSLVTEIAGAINDRLRDRAKLIENRKSELEKQGVEPNEDDIAAETELRNFQEEVQDMTNRLEQGMRALVDGENSVDRTEKALRWLGTNAGPSLAREYDTQVSQLETQRQTQTQRGPDRSIGNEDDNIRSSPGPTPFGNESITLTGPSEMFEGKLQSEEDRYLAHSLVARYGENNRYISFKRMVHDARHGDNAPPLPRANAWFNDRGSPAPGMTQVAHHADDDDDDDDDDDITIARETISTKCPLTLQQFKDPVTSTKCPHSFEKTAILEMIRQSRVSSRGERVVQCPVGGCEQMLSARDVCPDPILVRKIRRLQKANEEDSEEELSDLEDSQPDARGETKRGLASHGRSEIVDMGDPSDGEDEE